MSPVVDGRYLFLYISQLVVFFFSLGIECVAVIAEDPGIPHPGRHTTILGQTLRSNEITPANVSEVLRIYLYANATGEIKAMTGKPSFIIPLNILIFEHTFALLF